MAALAQGISQGKVSDFALIVRVTIAPEGSPMVPRRVIRSPSAVAQTLAALTSRAKKDPTAGDQDLVQPTSRCFTFFAI